ncbi:hypothetical protein INT46_005085 [Mucor plumbeus]|uniref:Uncharacterized protein n=1 Tax=Mucor plumbeus TaxID=97098 RepID=A0A8H7R3B4_9FUNG|nr:hypothetical protein INT46_005085 [Mucor plumbeus]
MNRNDSFWLVCDENNLQNCHCDWRVTIVDCIEREPMLYIYIVNAIWSFIVAVIAVGLLWHRVINKRLPIFDFGSPFGYFIRPKPIEAMLLFGIIFNMLRVLDAVLLITDAAPNVIFRAILYELPWQFGICAFACYLFGIAHTVSNSSRLIENSWFKISIKIDIICSIFITMPFLTNNVCSIAAAVYAEQGNFVKAKIFTDALYYLWAAYCFILATWILFAGLRLIKILQKHLDNQGDDTNSASIHKIKNGLFKVRMIMSISITSLFIFSFIKCMYGIMRTRLLLDHVLNLAIAIVWTYDGTLASMLVVMTVLINPKALASLSLSSSSHGRSSESYNRTTTRSNFATYKDDSTLATTSHTEVRKDKNYNFYRQSLDDLSQDRKNYYYASPPHNIVTSEFNEQKNISATQLVLPSHQ